jgi:ectoine hydroxylase-related dioxygenase (phytanoyl-CoA dioxygenase family)
MKKLNDIGFEIIEQVYSEKEVDEIIQLIDKKGVGGRFGVRSFLKDNLDIAQKVLTPKLLAIIESIAPRCEQSIKSIYFDKPPNANWIVNWHQDLTINLSEKTDILNFKNWRTIENRTVVQPSLDVLEHIFTVRIHLDECTQENGALRVIEGSHREGVVDLRQWMDKVKRSITTCEVRRGGVMIMKPLLVHSSRRTENQKNRRVIHIEFLEKELPYMLKWKESIKLHTNLRVASN